MEDKPKDQNKDNIKENGPDIEMLKNNESQKPSNSTEESQNTKEESFWDKYKNYLLFIAFVCLLYFVYLYYNSNEPISCPIKSPLEPFYEPQTNVTKLVSQVAEVTSDTLSEVSKTVKSGSI